MTPRFYCQVLGVALIFGGFFAMIQSSVNGAIVASLAPDFPMPNFGFYLFALGWLLAFAAFDDRWNM